MIQDLLASNRYIAYPFEEDSNLGELPRWLILDFRLINVAANDTAASGVVCKTMRVAGSSVVIVFVYKDGDTEESFSVSVVLGDGIRTSVIDVSKHIKVKITTCGQQTGLDELPQPGDYDIDAKILKTRLIELEPGARLMSVGGVGGTVRVVDGYNTEASIYDNEIHIRIGDGLGLGMLCEENDDVFDCSKALLFINGQHADTDGNINIVGGDGVIVQTGMKALVDGKSVPAISVRASEQVKGLV